MKKKIEQLIKNAIFSAVDAGELSLFNRARDQFYVDAAKDSKHGDFASTIALVIAKPEKKSPHDIAKIIIRRIDDLDNILEKIEIAGPGFINFFIKDIAERDALYGVLNEIEVQGANYGRSDIGNGKPVQIEFVSANPTGPLHIGHGRGAAVGDSLARLLSFAGYDVKKEFYINDFGSQVESLGNSIYARYALLSSGRPHGYYVSPPHGDDFSSGPPEDAPNLYLGEYISDLAQEFKARPEFEKLSEDEKKLYCREEGIKTMLRQIEDTLSKFGVSFDEWYSERKLYDPKDNLVRAAIDELREKGLVFEEGGAVWLRTTRFGDDKDRVLIRNNGQTTYFASDIAYHRDKFLRGFKEIIDVWGADHHGYIPRMKAAIQALGHNPDEFNVLLVQLVNLMREGQPVKMSKRAGTFVTLEEVMDEVGTDACRFTFLLRRPDSHLDFDLDLVKSQSSENPVYYVQYAHARLSSVFRQAAEKGIALPPIEQVNLSRLSLPEELAIIKRLSAFPELVEKAAEAKEPHRLTYYLQELAGELHSYYFRHKFISDDLELTYARMYLVEAVQQVIKTALNLLGVNAPGSM